MTSRTLSRRGPGLSIILASAAALVACGDGTVTPAEPADVRVVSLDLLPGNLLVGGTARVEAAVINVGATPSGPVGWTLRVGDDVVATGQLAGIAPGESARINDPGIGPFDVGGHAAVLEVEPAPGDAGDPSALVRERPFNVYEPGYSIDLRIIGDLTPNQEAAFHAARERWERVIVGSLEPTRVILEENECWDNPAGEHPSVDEVVEDLLIIALIGVYEDIIGLAGPCVLREDNLLAAMGLMVFHIPAMQHFEALGRLADVVAHEIGHVLGINPEVWEPKRLLEGAGGPDPRFVGTHGQRAFRAMTTQQHGAGVPVENEGGRGTRDAHWRWGTFTVSNSTELMTAVFSDENPLSALTIGALDDVGYAVDMSRAESFWLPGVADPTAAGPVLDIGDDRLPGPLRVVTPDGRTRVVLRRPG